MQDFAGKIALIDVLCSLALFANDFELSKPEITNDNSLIIENGFHPVIKKYLPDDINEYTANDSSFDMHVIKTAGGVKGDANKILNSVEMPAQETFSFNTERLILEEGDRVVLISPDADKLSATISYLEV